MNAVAPAAALLALLAAPAAAQSAAPLGPWVSASTGHRIWLDATGACAAAGTVSVSGTTAWSPTATSGVLTVTYQWTFGPATMGWSIRWLNAGTFLANEVERLVRVG